MEDREILVLSAADIRKALPMSRAIEAMKKAFCELSMGQAHMPARVVAPAPGSDGTIIVMPGFLSGGRRMGMKFLSLFPGNLSRGIPLIHALMTIMDGETGQPLCLMAGGALTAIRTGAATGAATDLLARRDAACVAILGAGVQGMTQLEAVCAVRSIRTARIYDPVIERAQALAKRMRTLHELDTVVAPTTREAIRGVDIICAATTSKSPVIADEDVEDGVHINAVGAFTPDSREIPEETVLRSFVVVDQREAALEEAGDLIIPLRKGLIETEHIRAELGEIIAGTEPGRTSDDQITLFKSVGLAIQDVAAAWDAFRAAESNGLGTTVRL